VKNDFDHFTSQLGLSQLDAKSWPSPFDYGRQGLLCVPDGLPDPLSSRFTEAVVDAAWPVIRAAGGRTFVLCTTLRAVRAAGELLRARIAAEDLDFPLLVQGEGSRSELLERFRRAGNAVLVGSQSFWEGIDVRGRALSLVVIDKLPFAPPDDPVLAARLDALARRGGNPFMDHQLPTAVIALKQGAGRLIRDETDRGVLMICDPRLVTKPYGRRIWQSLPPFRRTRDVRDAVAFFDDAMEASESAD
jgi:ATP-dependent DNA helicase DinG